MIHSYCAEYGEILLRPLHRYDIELLRKWRNEKGLNRYLRDIGYVTESMQEKWFESYIYDSDRLFFIINLRGIGPVGALALYNFRDHKCEIGKIVIGEVAARGKNVGKYSFLMVMCLAMQKLNIKKFSLDVHEDNAAAKTIYEKLGFKIVGKHTFSKGGFEYEMEIDAEDLVNINEDIFKILLFQENDISMEKLIWENR